MKEWVIDGGKELSGVIEVGGAKNSLVAILPACIVSKSIVKLSNVTPLFDTYVIIDILKKLNVRVIYDNKSKMIIDARNVKNCDLTSKEMTDIRASYYFMGALLSLYKNVSILGPGGCKFATRPIDLHLFAFECLGCKCEIEKGVYKFKKDKINNRIIKFSKVSVGATVNTILASCRIKGKVRLVNVALEPEIDDLITFLNKCGANIIREENDIVIKGVERLHGCEHEIMEDRIEAGTYLILGACIGNNLKIVYHESKYLSTLIELLQSMKVNIKIRNDYMIVNKCTNIENQKVVFDCYPNLATDLQQPLSILLTHTNRVSVLKDLVYPSRYTQIDDLNKMGFRMEVINECLYVYRSENLCGQRVSCKDLRGGMSLVIAGLIAKGETYISNVCHIERGYYNVISKLKRIGAKIYEKDM